MALFLIGQGDNPHCLVIDDELNILPISSHVHSIPHHDSFGAGMDEGDVGLSGIPEVLFFFTHSSSFIYNKW